MASFSRRLFDTLGDLDLQSQLIVIANNLRGISEQERDSYRALALNNDQRFIALLNAYKVDHNTDGLVQGLRNLGGTVFNTTYSVPAPPQMERQKSGDGWKQLYFDAFQHAVKEEVKKLNKTECVNYLAKYFAKSIAENRAYSNIMPITLAQAACEKLFQGSEDEKTQEEIDKWTQDEGILNLPENPNFKFLKQLINLQGGTQKAKSVRSGASKKDKQDHKFTKEEMFKLRDIVGLNQINAKQLVGYMRKYIADGKGINQEQFTEIMNSIGTKLTGWAQMRKNDALEKLFEIIDVNHDDIIDRNELSNSLILLAGGNSADKIEAMFMLYDINGDGLISFEELYAHQLCVFQIMFETNPKLKRQVGESAKNMAQITTESIFQQIDKNNDKVITLEEFQAWYNNQEVPEDIEQIKQQKLQMFYKKKKQIHRLLKSLKNQILNNKELENNIELADKCGFLGIHVQDAQDVFRSYNNSGFITRQSFIEILREIILTYGENPQVDTQDFNEYAYSLFASFNHDKSDVISMDELFCGLSIQCRGNLAEKMHAIFEVFEKSGDDLLNRNELYAFLSGILKKLMQGVALPQGVTIDTLVESTIKEIFKKFDIADTEEGGISYDQLMKWITLVST